MGEAEEKLQRLVSADAIMIATLTKAIKEKYGDEGLVAQRNALEETFRKIIPSIARTVGARIGDGGIADWAKVEKFICDASDMANDIEVTPQRGVLRVSTCPYLKQYQRTFPQFCTDVLIGMERAIAGTINPKMEVRGEKYLVFGDPICEIICELNED